jgi:hypothetical protein
VANLIQGHGQHAGCALFASRIDRALQQLGTRLALAQKQPCSGGPGDQPRVAPELGRGVHDREAAPQVLQTTVP